MIGGRKFPSYCPELRKLVLVTIYLKDGTQEAQIASLERRSVFYQDHNDENIPEFLGFYPNAIWTDDKAS